MPRGTFDMSNLEYQLFWQLKGLEGLATVTIHFTRSEL